MAIEKTAELAEILESASRSIIVSRLPEDMAEQGKPQS